MPVPPVEDSYVDPDNPYAGDDEPSMLEEMSRIKPPRGGALVKRRARPKSQLVKRSGALARRDDVEQKTYTPPNGKTQEDLIGDDPIPKRILELLGIEDAFDFTYGEYYQLLQGWQRAARMPDSKVSTEDSMLIDAEAKRVKRLPKDKKFKVNTKTVGRPTTKPATKPTSGMVGSSPEQPQLLLAPGEDGKKKRKRKASLEENVAAIRKSVDKIFKALNGQFEAIKKQAELDRLNKQRERRKKRENALEGAGKFMLKQARKLAAPTFDLLDKLFKFLGTVILGRVLFKLVEWLGNKENQEKIEALGRFLKDWWPVLLSAFVLFATPLGGLIRAVLAGVVKLSMFMAKKAIPGLLKFAKAHPLAAAAVGVGALGVAAVAANQDGTAVVKDPEKPNKSQMDEINEFGGMTGDPMSVLGTMSGGGRVPRYSKGGNVQRNKRTMPSGGKVSQSTGKRVKGAGKDTQMIVAQPGEIVMSKPAVDKIGAPFLLNLNKMGGGTNQPQFTKFGDLQFAQGGGLVGAKDIDMEKVMQTLRDAYITPDDLGPAGPDNPRIQNVANYLYGMEKLNTEGLDVFQIEDLQIAKKSYPKMDKKKKRGSTSFLSKPKTEDTKEKKPKAKPRPMGRSAAKLRKEKEGGDEKTAVSEEGQKSVKPSTQNNAPFAGSITPVKGLGEAKKSAPTAVIGQSKPNVDAPPPPQPTTNLISMSANGDQKPTSSATSAGGSREIDTAFSTSLATETRLMMMAIYGISEVE